MEQFPASQIAVNVNVPDVEQRLETSLSGSQDRHRRLVLDQEIMDSAGFSQQLANGRGADDTAEATLNEKLDKISHEFSNLITCSICQNDICMLETSRCIAIKQGSVEAMIHELSNTPYSIGKDQKHCYQIDKLRYQCLALDEESKSLTNEQGIPTYFATLHKN